MQRHRAHARRAVCQDLLCHTHAPHACVRICGHGCTPPDNYTIPVLHADPTNSTRIPTGPCRPTVAHLTGAPAGHAQHASQHVAPFIPPGHPVPQAVRHCFLRTVRPLRGKPLYAPVHAAGSFQPPVPPPHRTAPTPPAPGHMWPPPICRRCPCIGVRSVLGATQRRSAVHAYAGPKRRGRIAAAAPFRTPCTLQARVQQHPM